MICPQCGHADSKVVDSRLARDRSIRRRRQCLACKQRYTTYERVERQLPAVVKRDGAREAFDVAKVRAGIEHACRKLKVPSTEIDRTIEEVCRHFGDKGEREVESTEVGDVVLGELRDLDDVAYVRFASVYRTFRNVGQFLTELERLQDAMGAGERPN